MRETTSIDKVTRDKTAEAPATVPPVYAQTDVAGASNGRAAVCVYRCYDGSFGVYSYAPRAVGAWERRGEFAELVKRAAGKLDLKLREM